MRLVQIAILFISLTFALSCKKDDKKEEEIKSIKIAGLFSETGELSYLGLTSEAGLQIGVDCINQDFANRNIPIRFTLDVFDTELSPSIAKNLLLSLAGQDYNLIIGPQTSAELAMLKPVADSAGVLVVSPSSTASTLAVADDMIFRYSPGDQIVGQAMAKSYINAGKQALITLSRNDQGSLQLNSSAANHFVELGGQTFNAGSFDPSETDFSGILDEVKQLITQASTTYEISQIAVLTTSFDETILLLEQADDDPILSSVNWYGGIGFYKNQNILNSQSASHFASTTHFTSLGFSLPSSLSNTWQPLLNQINARTGLNGDALTLCAFDVLMAMAKMIESNDGVPNSGAQLRAAFMNASNGYQGATGLVQLNEYGDRANGTFDFWAVELENGNYAWTFVGQSE